METPDTNPKKAFTDYPLDPLLLEGLAGMGYTHPTPVQEASIPAVATGKDLMVQARTGTGKTLAFGLPTLNRIDKTSPDTQVLVVLPTRELAVQVADELARVASAYQIIVAAVFGGVKLFDQIDKMQWAPIVVGTPGRLRDHIERGYLHLDTCKVVVLDEADEMLDMGFKDDLEFILGKVPKEQRQTLLFSATFPPEITKIAHKYMRDPEKIEVSSGMTTAVGLSHKFARVPKDKKIQALATLLKQSDVTSGLIFCETKVETAWVFQRLKRDGFSIGILTGDIPQEKRLATLQAFRDAELNLLVATDVAARGLDIPAVSHVFHFTVPRDTATYVHRSGRTARAGKKGTAFTIVTPEEERDFQRIMRDIKQNQPGGEGGQRREGGREERGGRDRDRDQQRQAQPVQGGRDQQRGDRGPREERGPRDERGGRDQQRPGQQQQGRDQQRQGQPQQQPRRRQPLAPTSLAEEIAATGRANAEQYLALAESLIFRRDGVRTVAALLSQLSQADEWVEALAAAAPPQEAAPQLEQRAPREEREDRGGRRDRDRNRGRDRDRDRDDFRRTSTPVSAPEPEVEEREEAPAPAPTRTRSTRSTRPAAPVEAPAPEPEAPVAKPAAKRTTRSTKAAAAEAPAPEPVVEEAPKAKTTRTRKAAAPKAEEPVAEKPAAKKTTTRAKAAKAEEPAAEKPAAKKTTTRAKVAK